MFFKMLAQAEKLAQVQRISLLLGLEGSAAADFSQAPLTVSYFSLMVMFVKWGMLPPPPHPPCFYGRTISCTVPARHAENVQNLGTYQNTGARLKFTDFWQTTAVSAHRRPIKKW